MIRKIFYKIMGVKTVTPAGDPDHIKYVDSEGILMKGFRMECRFPEPGRKYLRVGADSMVSANFIFETGGGEVIIHPKSYIGGSTFISRSRIEVGSYVFIAWGCYFYDHDSHSVDYRDRRKDIEQQLSDYNNGKNFIENKNWEVVKSRPIVIEDDAWIGMNCIILKGVTIGRGAIISAGSVVTGNVEPWSVYAGNPARKVRDLARPESS